MVKNIKFYNFIEPRVHVSTQSAIMIRLKLLSLVLFNDVGSEKILAKYVKILEIKEHTHRIKLD